MYVGIALMVLGGVLFLAGKWRRPPTRSVTASGGSVAIGGKSTGDITNINVGSRSTPAHGGHGLTIAVIVVEIIGILVVIWHAIHLVHK